MKKGVIFDMDGTLWDSAASVAGCWTEVLKNKYDGIRTVTEEDLQSVWRESLVIRIYCNCK